MGFRWLVVAVVVLQCSIGLVFTAHDRSRRDTEDYTSSIKVVDAKDTHRPDSVILSASSPSETFQHNAAVPYAIPNGYYQPSLVRASDYKPLISSSQTQSVRYQPPNDGSHGQPLPAQPLAYSYSQSSQGQNGPLLTSAQTGNLNSVAQPGNRQGFAYSGDHASVNQFNNQPPPPAQTIPKPSKEEGKNDEYIVYYYYYYDNDTASGNSSNFDDIPSLESYDTDKPGKDSVEKSSVVRTVPAVEVNSLPRVQDGKGIREESSQPRSVPSGSPNQQPFIRADRQSIPDDTVIQPLKPVSNVYRYAGNEVPRLPVLPNFVVSDAPSVTRHGSQGSHLLAPESPTTQPPISISISRSRGINSDHHDIDDSHNLVVDRNAPELKSEDGKGGDSEGTSTTTSTEPTTTTEEPTTTTTEKSRRRPGAGGRRRFNPSPSFSSNRRQSPSKSSTSSTTTTTTTSSPGAFTTRGSFRGPSRARPRPTLSSNRPRPSFGRSVSTSDANSVITKSTESTTTTSTTVRPRFGGSSSSSASSGRRFSSTRTRSSSIAPARSTSTTQSPIRSRPSTKPKPPSPIIRNRPPRPGFFRPKAVTEPEEPETTTSTSDAATEASPSSELSSPDVSDDDDTREDVNDEEGAEEQTEEPTTTEKSRFSALFRPRNRSPLNRPRPVLDRSRRS